MNAMKEVESVLEGNTVSDQNIFPMVCDHTCFSSVRKFCQDLRKQLRSMQIGIDVLCLNAAILLGENAEAQYTEDDIEITFQTNHLAPFLIGNLLFDMINPGGRVVVTSSGLHAFSTFDNFLGVIDPETGQTRKRFAMIDGASFDHKKSYAASKLCNVAFCLGLNRRLQKKGAVAICFTPGLIPSSGLFRHQKRWNEAVLKKRAVGIEETEEWGGIMLAWMAFADEAGKPGAYSTILARSIWNFKTWRNDSR
jgi:NAD(P)-dependent dehydrogenase (short-subunit alcohol dehydrogenase family)